MQLTFEKTDIIRIMEKVLKYNINDDDVTITAEPFTVCIRNVNLNAMATPPPQPEPTQEEEDTVSYTDDDEDSEGVAVLTMDEIMNKNTAMGGAGATRQLGMNESEEPPPITEEEMRPGR